VTAAAEQPGAGREEAPARRRRKTTTPAEAELSAHPPPPSDRPTEPEAEPSFEAPDLERAEDERLEGLARSLGVAFRDIGLLRLAMTHRSVIQDVVAAGGNPAAAAIRTNERLEFLGDAVLGAIAAEYLYERDAAADEGTLTRHRVALVRAETLVRWARELKLGDHLYLGHGERPSEGARDRMLAGAFEAVVGAIAVDAGYEAAKAFLARFLDRDAPAILDHGEGIANPKGLLQELLQERYRQGPHYRTVAAEGPAHAQLFTVEVAIAGTPLGTGSGGSKREAQQAAAADALRRLDAAGGAHLPGAAGDEPAESG